MRIAIYGNLIYDQLITIDSQLYVGESHNCTSIEHRAGGIVNFCRALSSYSNIDFDVIGDIGNDDPGFKLLQALNVWQPTNHVRISKTPTTTATVIVHENDRTGIVQWGACRERCDWEPVDADWHHFMYLDRMNITKEQLLKFPRNTSADFCGKPTDYQDLAKCVDYVIASDCESWPTRRGVISHSPTQIHSIMDGVRDTLHVSRCHGLNVVGAGDYFAAHCIANLLLEDFNLLDIHQRTATMLVEQSP